MSLADYLREKENFLDYLLWDYQENYPFDADGIVFGATEYTLPQFLDMVRNENAVHHVVANEICYTIYNYREVQMEFRKYLSGRKKQ